MEWTRILEVIAEATGLDAVRRAAPRSIGGGCINAAYLLEASGGIRFFVKVNRGDRADMFAAEAEGLEELAKAEAIRVPGVICHGAVAGVSFLCLEALKLSSRRDAASQRRMGAELARLHRYLSEDRRFGWHRDNTIGETPQINTWESSWIAFYGNRRLEYQLKLAERKGLSIRGSETLLENLDAFFASYDPEPSLLHGDLWGGNAAFDEKGNPVLFDPAVYYGDREADLAFTELFGGFGPAFYEGYQETWPLDAGYKQRKTLYNLYHVLNHFHIFGGGYGEQAKSMTANLVDWLG